MQSAVGIFRTHVGWASVVGGQSVPTKGRGLAGTARRSRACPTSALKINRNRQQSISIGAPLPTLDSARRPSHRVVARLVPATSIVLARCLQMRSRRDKPGDDAVSDSERAEIRSNL